MPDEIPSPIPPVLWGLDGALTAGAAVVMVVLFRWRGGNRLWSAAMEDWPVRPNRVREDAIAVAMLIYLTAALLFSIVVGRGADAEPEVGGRVLVNNGSMLVGIAGCLWIGGERFAGGWRAFVFGQGCHGARTWFIRCGVVLFLGLGLCPLVRDATVALVEAVAPGYAFKAHPTIEELHRGQLPAATIMGLWVGAAVLAPLGEELFFRGLVQTTVLNLTGRRTTAVVLTALAFGAVHFPQVQAVGALVLLGLLLGWLYERTGSLAPPIGVHALFNLKTLVWDALARGGGG